MDQTILILHNRAIGIAERFHKEESNLISVLQEIDDQRAYLELGYTSLFDYSVKALKLSEPNASNFICIARKSKIVPELKAAIDAGYLTVSKARKITPVITKDNQAHWLNLAKTLPKPKLEKEVAKVRPELAIQERARYVSESRMELKLGLAEETMGDFKRAQDIVCQKTKRAANYEETFKNIVEYYLKHEDPIEKAKRSVGRESANTDTQASNIITSVPGTRYIRAQTKHKMNLRDLRQCSHVNSKGERCQNKRWLDVHHQIPLFFGGTHDLSNLKTLCSAHHKLQHRSDHENLVSSASPTR